MNYFTIILKIIVFLFCTIKISRIFVKEITTKKIEIMKAIDLQKRMNMYLAKKNYKLAYNLFLEMNLLRLEEGKELLTMPNLQARFE